MRVLVLRSEGAAAATAAALVRKGHQAVRSPVTIVEQTGSPPPPGPFAGVIVTSRNAVSAIIKARSTLQALPFHVVGQRTAATLREEGFLIRHVAPDASGLADAMAADLAPAPFLHAAGRDRRAEPAANPTRLGFSITSWIVYRAEPVGRLSDETVEHIGAGRLDAVLHYSTRSARIVRDLVTRAGLEAAFSRLPQLCLSDEIAAELDGLGAPISIAAAPDEDALLDLLGR